MLFTGRWIPSGKLVSSVFVYLAVVVCYVLFLPAHAATHVYPQEWWIFSVMYSWSLHNHTEQLNTQQNSGFIWKIVCAYMLSLYRHQSIASSSTLCWKLAHVSTSRCRRSSTSQTDTWYTRFCTNLSHDGLIPAHVPCWWVNNPTLGEFCFTMIGRADIEGSNDADADAVINRSLVTTVGWPMSGLMNWVSHSAGAWLRHEHDVPAHCLRGR